VGNTWLTWLADDLQAAGLRVVRYQDWQTRARSSGGYSGAPLVCMWHHTASNTSPANDAYYMCYSSGDRPICNVLVARNGEVWVLAAGATNTNGKGRARDFSRGSVPANSMNSWAVGIEIANNGVGEQYPQAQIDAAFVVSNTVNARCGNQPTDVCTHQDYAPDRKIDPATCNVGGSWQPRSCTSSGTWNVADLRDECGRRGRPPTPGPQPEGEEVFTGYWQFRGKPQVYALYSNGTKLWLENPATLAAHQALTTLSGGNTNIAVQDDAAMFQAFGPIVGPVPPGVNAWGL
jgi:hypothetical protein